MLSCAFCEKQFKYESEKKRHEQSHTPQFECKVCSKKFSFLSAVRRHEKQHTRTGKVQCSTCGGKFRDDILLKRHMKYAHKGVFECEKCSETYSSEAALKTHLKVHKPESERRFRCSHEGCGKTFNFAHHLKHHELAHKNEKQHFCNVCKKGFIQYHHLKTHLRIHEPENWLKCPVANCTKKFTTEYARKRHFNTHYNNIATPDSEISSDSNSANDSSKSNKDTFVNKRCGELLENKKSQSEEKYEERQKNILELNNSNETEHDIVQEYLSSNKYLDTDRKYSKQFAHLLNNISGTVLSENFENKNKSIVKCISSGNLRNRNDTSSNQNTESSSNRCKDCDCSSSAKLIPNTKYKLNKAAEMPELEYRVDGIIKIKETFDIDIKQEKADVVVKLPENEKKFIPYNSCKAILGNCIVSEDGKMGEGCLCAKMAIDEEEMNAQEIDELTPICIS